MRPDFFVENRQRLMNKHPNGVFVFAGYTEMQRSNDMSFLFQQEANFYWLSGITTADWWMIIDGTEQKTYLVQPKVSETHQIFDGSVSSEAALAISGVDEIVGQDEADTLLETIITKTKNIYGIAPSPHTPHYDFTENPAPLRLWKKLNEMTEAEDCRKTLARLRAIKRPVEIEALQKAVDISAKGFLQVKERLESLQYEYEAEAELSYVFRRLGGQGHAYDPIVASGKNACTLHYTANSNTFGKDDLLLIDAATQIDGYAADITRTYARNPSERQQEVHAAVQKAQRLIIDLIKPGVSFNQYQIDADEIMKDALEEIGLLKNRTDKKTYRKYFPHAVSHGLGLDVHESLGGYKEFQPGMVLTVEPGIYIEEEGIGVRIEDDILVTETGNENLSEGLSTSL